MDSFADAELPKLIQHAILSLKGPANDKELTTSSVAIAIVGENTPFKILGNAELQEYLDSLRSELGSAIGGDEDQDDDEGAAGATAAEGAASSAEGEAAAGTEEEEEGRMQID